MTMFSNHNNNYNNEKLSIDYKTKIYCCEKIPHKTAFR